jgi:hypothetical protein
VKGSVELNLIQATLLLPKSFVAGEESLEEDRLYDLYLYADPDMQYTSAQAYY